MNGDPATARVKKVEKMWGRGGFWYKGVSSREYLNTIGGGGGIKCKIHNRAGHATTPGNTVTMFSGHKIVGFCYSIKTPRP